MKYVLSICIAILFMFSLVTCSQEKGHDLTSPEIATHEPEFQNPLDHLAKLGKHGLQKPQTEWENVLVYEVEGMEDVVIKSHTYRPMGTEIRARDVSERSTRAQMGPVTFDIYYPPGMKGHERLPVVVEVIGFSDESELIKTLIGVPEGMYVKDHPYFTSLGRMLAASGVIAVCYRTTRWDDLWALIDYMRDHSNALKIDPDNIGLWAISAQPVIASSYAFQPDREYIKYGVNSYGVTWTPDMDADLVEGIRQFAHAVDFYFDELPEPTVWRSDMPMFVVRCGNDADVVKNTTDYFVEHAPSNDVPLEFVEYEEGIHGYDYLQYTDRSAEILKQALHFVLEQAF